MLLATLLSVDVVEYLTFTLIFAFCALPFSPLGESWRRQHQRAERPHVPGEDEGRPRPPGIRPRGFQVQAAGASAPADVDEAERQRVAARLKAEADQRARCHSGWENLVPGVPCLTDRICGAMAMPRLVQPQADVLPPARVQ